tara:strand:- start:259205 stop:259870 length:666 start_codon:yes stop_codon:yes gene_type:complete
MIQEHLDATAAIMPLGDLLVPDEPNPFSVESTMGQAKGINPYAPTADVSSPETDHDDAETMRKFYLSHEASVKSIGTLFFLGAIFLVLIGLSVLASMLGAANHPDPNARVIVGVIGLVYLVMGLFQGLTGVAIRQLRPWSRIAAIILSGIGLLGFPIGTLISGYFLYLLVSEKGKMVFSPAYQKVIQQTPHIKYKTSIIVWILLGILLFILSLGLVAALFA